MCSLPAPVPHEGHELAEIRTVIVIEDDAAARHSTAALLELLGYRTRTFESCEAFLADPDFPENAVLLLDYHFDGASGFALLETLTERGTPLPTVIYSGRFTPALRRRAAGRSEIVAIVEKPSGGHAIAEAVAKAFTAPRPA